jgi:hypothetical protein
LVVVPDPEFWSLTVSFEGGEEDDVAVPALSPEEATDGDGGGVER